MAPANIVADELERFGVRTFSAKEMAFNILHQKADLHRAVACDNAADYKVIHGVEAERLLQSVDVLPCANFRFEFPNLESGQSLQDLAALHGLIDLDKVVTIEGAIEMAWIMGFIKHF